MGCFFFDRGFTESENPRIETVEKKLPKPIDKLAGMMYNHYRKQSKERQ